jgi:hypothetical protein
MDPKAVRRCTAMVNPLLRLEERIDLVNVVQIGKVSTKRHIGVSAASVAVGVLTGVAVLRALWPRAYFMVLTNERLMLIDSLWGGVGKSVVAAIPRRAVVAGPLRPRLLRFRMAVSIDGTEHGFSWGLGRGGNARRIAAALGAPSPNWTPACP